MKKLTKEKYKNLLAHPNEWNPGDFVTIDYYDKWKEYFQSSGHLEATPLYYSKTEDFVSAYVVEKTLESHELFRQSNENANRMVKSFLYLTMIAAFLKRFSSEQTDKTALQTLTQEFIISANDDLLGMIRGDIIKSDYKIVVYQNSQGGVSLSKRSNGTKVEDENKEIYFSYVDRVAKLVLDKDDSIQNQIHEHISDIQKVFI